MRAAWLVVAMMLAGSSLAGCSAVGPNPTPAGADTATTTMTTMTPTSVARQKAESRSDSCTDRIDYAGDPRSNAEINSIGERTGACPSVEKKAPTPSTAPAGDPTVSCTNRFDYAGDPRSNAEINSIGASTGTCPAPQR